MQFASHVGAFAVAVDPLFPNSELNAKHIYTVDVAFYTVQGFMVIVNAAMKMLMVGANIQFYATRMELYGTAIPIGATSFFIDFVMLILLPFPLLLYAYQIVGGVFVIQ